MVLLRLFFVCNVLWFNGFFKTQSCAQVILSNYSFPPYFKFGTASSAYQIEGAWNEDGKGPSIWDHYLHLDPTISEDQSNGDIACDSYHKWKEDVALLKELGVNFYRFSLSWSRILPNGFSNKINKKGLNYYRNLLLELKKNNIEAMVTIYHWDLPLALQNIGGWTNDVLIEHTVSFARLVFKEFGDLVSYWVTFNEPAQICEFSYGTQIYVPIIASPGIGNYLCVHNLLKTHARIWHMYDEEFRPDQKGKISLVMEVPWVEPVTNSTEDILAAETFRQFYIGWFANPVYNKNYPQIMIDRIANRSKMEGFEISRLPQFTEEEIKYISGTYDFFGFNHYTTYLVEKIPEPEYNDPSWVKDTGVKQTYSQVLPGSTVNFWLKIAPLGIRNALNWIKKNYNNPEVIITENGFSDAGDINDPQRISYLQEYLSNILDAMVFDDVNVTAYTLWGFLDDFEWASGYVAKFGLFHVNLSDPNRTRTPKKSVEFYKEVIRTHCLLAECQTYDYLSKSGTPNVKQNNKILLSNLFLVALIFLFYRY